MVFDLLEVILKFLPYDVCSRLAILILLAVGFSTVFALIYNYFFSSIVKLAWEAGLPRMRLDLKDEYMKEVWSNILKVILRHFESSLSAGKPGKSFFKPSEDLKDTVEDIRNTLEDIDDINAIYEGAEEKGEKSKIIIPLHFL